MRSFLNQLPAIVVHAGCLYFLFEFLMTDNPNSPRWKHGRPKDLTEIVSLCIAILPAVWMFSVWNKSCFSRFTSRYFIHTKGDMTDSFSGMSIIGGYFGAVQVGIYWIRFNALKRCINSLNPLYSESHCEHEPMWIINWQRSLLRGTSNGPGDSSYSNPFLIFPSYLKYVHQLPAGVFALVVLGIAGVVMFIRSKKKGVTEEDSSSAVMEPQRFQIVWKSLITRNSPSIGSNENGELMEILSGCAAEHGVPQDPIIKRNFSWKKDCRVRQAKKEELEKCAIEEDSGEEFSLPLSVVRELDKFLEESRNERTSPAPERNFQNPRSPETEEDPGEDSFDYSIPPSVMKQLNEFLEESRNERTSPERNSQNPGSPETEEDSGEDSFDSSLPPSVMKQLDEIMEELQSEETPSNRTPCRKPKSSSKEAAAAVRRRSERLSNKPKKPAEENSEVEKPSSSRSATNTPVSSAAAVGEVSGARGRRRSSRISSTHGDVPEDTPKKAGKKRGRK